MIRAYHDPGLRYPISRTGSWGRPLEFVLSRGDQQTKTIYLYNNNSHPESASLLTPAVDKLAVGAPAGIQIPPGITPFEVTLAGNSKEVPYVEDFIIRYIGEGVQPPGGWSDSDFSDWDAHLTSPVGEGQETFRIEVSVYILPAGDERYGIDFGSHVRTQQELADYITSGMGLVHEDFHETQVKFMADMLHPLALWSVNKHYLHDPAYGPLRHARNRAELIGYNPPGLDQFPPKVRRRVLANAFKILRNLGTREGYLMAFEALGVETKGILVEHDALAFTWVIRLPRYAVGTFDLDYLGNYALYHTDAYNIVDLGLVEDAFSTFFSDLDYTAQPTSGASLPETRSIPSGDTRVTPEGDTRVVQAAPPIPTVSITASVGEWDGIAINWTQPDTGSSAKLYRGEAPEALEFYEQYAQTHPGQSFTTTDDSPLAMSGTRLYYAVTIVDGDGNEGPFSNIDDARYQVPASGSADTTLPTPSITATGDFTPADNTGSMSASLPTPQVAATGVGDLTLIYMNLSGDPDRADGTGIAGLPSGNWEAKAFIRPATWTPADYVAIISHWGSTAGTRSFRFNLEANGFLRLVTSADGDGNYGSAAISTAAVPFSDGDAGWVRAVLTEDRGDGSGEIVYYTSPDNQNWTQLGDPVVISGGIFTYDQATGDNYVGRREIYDYFVGDIIRVTVYDDHVIAGGQPLIEFYPNRDAADLSDTSWTSGSTGETWTLAGSATLQEDDFGQGGGSDTTTLTEYDVLAGATGSTNYPDAGTAFASAEGYGRNTQGARAPGTAITMYYVTNLNDSGTGSLRAALEATGPRIVVILVSGWIELQEGINTGDGNLTVYGNWIKSGYQGHAVRMYRTTAWGSETQPLLSTNGDSEIILRYLRGYRAPHPDFVSAGHTEQSGDGFVISDVSDVGAQNGIMDHINMAFTTDDSGGFWGYLNGTLQHTFFGDPIGGMHDKGGGGHDYGPIISTRGNETMHHCFFNRINERTPRVSSRDNSQVDIYNVYAYNTTPGHQFATDGQNQHIHFTDSWNEEGPYTTAQNKPYWAKFIEDGDPMFTIHIARCRGYRISGTSFDAMWAGQDSTYAYSGNIDETMIRSDTELFTPPNRLVHDVDNELRDFIRNYAGFSWVIDPDTGDLTDVRDSYHMERVNDSINGTGPNDTIDGDEVETTIPHLPEWTPPGATYTDQVNWFLQNYFEPWANERSGLGFTANPTNLVTLNGHTYTEIEYYLMSLIPDFPSL